MAEQLKNLEVQLVLASLACGVVGCHDTKREVLAPLGAGPAIAVETINLDNTLDAKTIGKVYPASGGGESSIELPDSGGVCVCWSGAGAQLFIEEHGVLVERGQRVVLEPGTTRSLGSEWGSDLELLVRHTRGYKCRPGKAEGLEKCAGTPSAVMQPRKP